MGPTLLKWESQSVMGWAEASTRRFVRTTRSVGCAMNLAKWSLRPPVEKPQGRKSSLCWTAQLNELDTRRFDPVAELAQFPDHLLRAFAFPGFDHRRTPFFITHLPVQKDPN